MRQWKNFIVVVLIIALAFSGVALVYKKSKPSRIRDFVFEKDAAAVETLMHKGDNWYWMINDYSINHGYSVDHMLRYRSSSQHEKLYNLVIKVVEINQKVAGLLIYHPNSVYTWQLLFVLVDQDYRRQGIAKEMVRYAIDDMVRRGAVKIDLVTRPVNIKAKALYPQMGFKQINEDKDFAYFVWYKSQNK